MNELKNKRELIWTESVKAKFEALKECFKNAPVRGYPRYDTDAAPFILDTDWSRYNMAGILSQEQDGKEVFLAAVAKKNNKAEANYPAHKGEMASFVLCCRKFEHMLRARKFILRTDSKFLEYLKTMKEYRGIYARWMSFLAGFRYTVQYRKGKAQTNADALSRMPGLEEEGGPNPVEDLDDPLQDVDDIYVINTKMEEVTVDRIAEETKSDPTMNLIQTI
jgi:hypothetical protein